MESNGNRKKTEQQKNRVRHKSVPPIEVRRSGVHGQGGFATREIRRGERIIEYKGERMPWDAASEDPDDPHTFLFGLSESNIVINAGIGGNDARWINHSCDPNCEAVEEGDRVFIYALRDLRPGEELFYDYGLEIDEPRSPETEKQFQCMCGSSNCRGTLLAPKERAKSAAQ